MFSVSEISIPVGRETTSALLEIPPTAFCLLVLGHGAGSSRGHATMEALAVSLHALDIATFRYNFLYREQGRARPDMPDRATAVVAAAVRVARQQAPHLPLFAGGRSFGARMTTLAASRGSLPDVRGIVCFAFPLHRANQPSTTRAEHLVHVRQPVLFIQGTRDSLAQLDLMEAVVQKSSDKNTRRGDPSYLHRVEGADHSFRVLRSFKRDPAAVAQEIAEKAKVFCLNYLGTTLAPAP